MIVFDLDQTIINSIHRTPFHSDGTVDIQGYIQNQTKENIMKDTILPLADTMKKEFYNTFIVVCTARKMTDFDYEFLSLNGLRFHEIYERGNVPKEISSLPDALYKTKCLNKYKKTKYTFYDDSEEVINLFKQYPNVNMIDSKIMNA